ncbi:uncharacterized protein LOC111033343 [Myzus persicae]|uniref:uncharacterized protein LOC111033343 n=1 Tax=Myzus persicae TaxID=13164 RepID=UPI000B930408|nr:uncharacterized protein LOC111033343 [Myzus persicae]
MISNSFSHAISGTSLSLVLLFLLQPLWGSGSGGVLGLEEESSQIMDEIPAAHREGLELLKTALAMDVQWSAFWSEKIDSKFIEESDLVPEFCPSMPASMFEKKPIHSMSVVKQVMEHCPHSGMYVDFAVSLLALSAQCMFNRHAILQLATIESIPFKAITEFTQHLGRLLGDYRQMANSLATVGAELHPLIALSRFFNEVKRQWVTYIEDNGHQAKYKSDLRLEVGNLVNLLMDSSLYCDKSPTIWYGLNSKDTVKLDMHDIEPKFSGEEIDDSLTSTLPEDEVPNEPSVRKAHKLRLILKEEFEKLHLGKIPQEVWDLMFAKIILARQIETEEKLSFKKKAFKKISSFLGRRK